MIRIAVAALVVAVVIAVLILTNGCAGSDPAAALYTAERLRCVQREDAAPENAAHARDCLHAVDRAYGQDGGR